VDAKVIFTDPAGRAKLAPLMARRGGLDPRIRVYSTEPGLIGPGGSAAFLSYALQAAGK
jgi:hypothetical protein